MSWRRKYPIWRRADVRLTFWYTAALLLTLSIVCGFFAYRLYHNMLKQVDAVLLDEAHEIEGFIKKQESKVVSVKWFVRSQLDQRKNFRIHLRVLGPVGIHRVADHGPERGPFILDSSILEAIDHGQPQYQTVWRRIPFRQLSVLLSGPDGRPHVIQISTRLDLIRNAMNNFFHNILVLMPIALLLCATGGWLVAHKTLSPIKRIAQAAERISAQDLKERLPSSQTGDEIDELLQTINRMFDRLERSFSEIRKFSADAAHEIRTPLCAMRGEAEVLLSRERPETDYRGAIERFMEQFDRLTKLTNDLLLLARFEAQKTPIRNEGVGIGELLNDLINFFEVLAQERGIHLRVGIENAAEVRGDRPRLQQAFSNLLDNAVKYSPDRGEITVAMERDQCWLRIRITNTGEGIPSEDLPRVFDRFYRVDKSRSRQTGGSGLGLNIARKIIEMHRGQIQIQSIPNQVTTVTVELPVAT